MESSKCTKKNIARTGSLKVKCAAKPRAKSALGIEKKEDDPGTIRWHMICWSKGTVCGCFSRCYCVVFLCLAHLHNFKNHLTIRKIREVPFSNKYVSECKFKLLSFLCRLFWLFTMTVCL